MKATRSRATKERAFTKHAKLPGQKKLDTRVGVAKGFGPRHAENRLEGEEVRLQEGGLVPDLDTLGVRNAKGNLMLERGPREPGRYTAKQLAGDITPGDDEQGHTELTPEQLAGGAIGGSYKTIGVEIDGKETEIPMWQGQTPDEAEEMARMRLEWGLDPFAPDSELEAVQNAAHQGPDDASAVENAGSPEYQFPVRPGHPLQATYARGTPDVAHLAGGSGDFNPNQWTFYNPGGGGIEGGLYGNRDNLLNPYQGQAGTQQNPISLAYGPGRENWQGRVVNVGGPFGWGRYEDFGPGVHRQGDIAVGGQYGALAKKGWIPRMFQSGRNFAGDVGSRWGSMTGGDRYWGRGQDMPGFPGQSGGMAYYPEGSRMSQVLGPALEGAWGSGGGGSGQYAMSGQDIRNLISSDYSGNLQASTNPLDYLNPFGGTSKGGSGTGDPTQRGVGLAVGTASNLILPGLGFITGPLARWATNLIQHGATKQQAAQMVAQRQKETAMPHGSVSLPGGQGAQGGEGNFSPDYLRSIGYREGQGTGSLWPGGGGLGGAGGGGGSFYGGNLAPHWASTAIGFGGNLGGSGVVNAGAFHGNAGLNRPYSAEQYANLSGNMKYPAPAIANAWGGPTQRPSYQSYLQAWHPTGGGRGMRQRQPGAMAHTPRIATAAKGDSDVPDPDEELKSRISRYDDAIAGLKRENELEEAWSRRMMEIPPILNKLPGQYQDYYPEEHEEVPVKRKGGARHFDPGSLGQYPLMAAKGKTSTDTVPAMLTPREAVLNRNAAELAGRENIEELNAQGNQLAEKGVDLAGENTMKPKTQKFQGGAAGVDPLTMYRNRLGTSPTPDGGPQPAQQPPQVPPGYGGPPQRMPPDPRMAPQAPMARPQSASFYPGGYQGGAAEVQEQADPFWKGSDLPQLTAGRIDLAALKKEAQKNGMTAEQVSAIAKVMGGMGGGSNLAYGDSIPGSGGYAAGGFAKGEDDVGDVMQKAPSGGLSREQELERLIAMYKAAIGGGIPAAAERVGNYMFDPARSRGPGMMEMAPRYQGGISDIGYPPFIAPNAEYHADKGSSWVGPYDPNYYITRQQ